MSEKFQYLPEVHEQVDPWHAHTPDEGLPQEEHASRPNTVLLWGALISSVIFMVITVIVIVLYFSTYTNNLRLQRVETTVLAQQQRQQKLVAAETLGDYNLLPAQVSAEPVITIPIEQAKQRVLERYGK